MRVRFGEAAALSIPDTIARNAYVVHFEAIRVEMLATQLLGVRPAPLNMTLPALGLVFFATMVDGLVQRSIRRASGGRESASVYQRAKHLQPTVFALVAAFVLLLPVSYDPRWTSKPRLPLCTPYSRTAGTWRCSSSGSGSTGQASASLAPRRPRSRPQYGLPCPPMCWPPS